MSYPHHLPRHALYLMVGAFALTSLADLTTVEAKKRSKKASISKELRAELEAPVKTLTTSEEDEARQAALLSWGLLIDKKALPELEALKTAESPEVRLGAALGLMLADAKKSEEFVVSELDAQGELYLKLRDRVAVIPDSVEWTLLDELLDKKDPATTRDVLRHLSMQRGELLEELEEMATAKKDSELRKAALEALVNATTRRHDLLETADTLQKKKDLEQRQAALKMYQNLTQFSATNARAVEAIASISKDDKDEALRMDAMKFLLAEHNVTILPDALALASSTDDVALQSLIIRSAHEAMEHGYKPQYKDLSALLEKKIVGDLEVMVAQLAARSGDETYKSKLLELFQSNTFEERLLAAQAMGYTGDEAMVQLLSGSLFEGDRRIRLYSAQSLGLLGKESGLKALQQSLSREKDKTILLAVVDSLGQIPSDESARILRMQTTKNDAELREHVVLSYLRHQNPENTKSLELLLRDREERVRWLAFLTTLALDNKQGSALFSSMLRSPPSSWSKDITLLGTKEQDLIITELVRHKSSSVQASALGFALKHPERYDALLKELLLDKSYKESARMTILANLAEQGGKTAQTLIERIAGSEDSSSRLSHQAAWYLVRDTAPSIEATLRGMTSKKDPVLQALAMYGLLTMKKD